MVFLAEVESRTQGSRPRPRTQKKSEAKAKDSLSEDRRTDALEAKDRNARGQGPRTRAQVLSKKKQVFTKIFQAISKKKVFTKIFQAISKKKGLHKNFSSDLHEKTVFQALHKILTVQKLVLSSSRGQANFRELEASRPRPRTSKCVLEDSTSGF